MELQRIGIGNGGWVRLFLDGRTEKPFVIVRFAEVDGALKVREMYLEGPISNTTLRYLSVPAIEDVANLPNISRPIRNHLDILAPDVREVARWYNASGWYPEPPAVVGRRSQTVVRLSEIDARLDVPEKRPYPDEFYVSVAAVYRQLVARGQAPAPAIAEANNKPITTVHRWIRTARDRGLLRKARGAGRAGEER